MRWLRHEERSWINWRSQAWCFEFNGIPRLVSFWRAVDSERDWIAVVFSDCGEQRGCLVVDGAGVSLFRYLATGDQYGDDDRDVSDGVFDSEHAEPGYQSHPFKAG